MAKSMYQIRKMMREQQGIKPVTYTVELPDGRTASTKSVRPVTHVAMMFAPLEQRWNVLRWHTSLGAALADAAHFNDYAEGQTRVDRAVRA